jgi:hypothetical protein
MKTLPQLAVEWGVNANTLKSFVQRRKKLAALGELVGKCRGYRPAEAQRIRAAWDARRRSAAAVA